MEYDHGARGQPASDGSLQGSFGVTRRYTERATNIDVGQGAGSPGGELGRISKRVSARTENRPPETAATYVEAEPATTRRFNVNSDGSISELKPQPVQDELYSKQLHQIEVAQRSRGMSAQSATVLQEFVAERVAARHREACRRREKEMERQGDGSREKEKRNAAEPERGQAEEKAKRKNKRLGHFGGPARSRTELQRSGGDDAWLPDYPSRPITDASWHIHLDDRIQAKPLLDDGADPVYYVHSSVSSGDAERDNSPHLQQPARGVGNSAPAPPPGEGGQTHRRHGTHGGLTAPDCTGASEGVW